MSAKGIIDLYPVGHTDFTEDERKRALHVVAAYVKHKYPEFKYHRSEMRKDNWHGVRVLLFFFGGDYEHRLGREGYRGYFLPDQAVASGEECRRYLLKLVDQDPKYNVWAHELLEDLECLLL